MIDTYYSTLGRLEAAARRARRVEAQAWDTYRVTHKEQDAIAALVLGERRSFAYQRAAHYQYDTGMVTA